LPQLVADLANSHLYALLSPFEPEAIRIATVLEPEKAPYLEHYLTRVYSLKPRLNGDFLKNLGMKPGKEFRVILDELREAVLDGLLKTEEEEANFLRSKMSQRP
jgi:tRNA nucleotidyltransferase (CCA-adding enzyme)